MDCIFCDIIQRKSPAEIIYEDEKVISFLDIRPINYGHTLVIPIKHYEDFISVPGDEMNAIINVTQTISDAVSKSLKADGFNIIANNGAAVEVSRLGDVTTPNDGGYYEYLLGSTNLHYGDN